MVSGKSFNQKVFINKNELTLQKINAMIKKLMFIWIVTVALMSCSTSQSTSSSVSSGSTTTEKASKDTPNKTPGETPITQPVEKNSAKSIIALPAE